MWTTPDWLLDTLADRYPGCLYRIPTHERLLALTLDDGPDVESTPLILAELRQHDARATFFLISSKLTNRERIVHAIVSEGHELGNHFTRDRPSIGLDSEEFESDLAQAHQALAPLGRIRWARPGSGWYSQDMVKIMRRNGYHCALGSVYPFDAAIPSVAWAARYVLRNARPGRVIVLHDGGARGRRTARVLARVLPELRERGFRIVSLSELVDLTAGSGPAG
jgi:peptidoglycan/xylan/chitin deacetylase (PgdA/CDA1 family)